MKQCKLHILQRTWSANWHIYILERMQGIFCERSYARNIEVSQNWNHVEHYYMCTQHRLEINKYIYIIEKLCRSYDYVGLLRSPITYHWSIGCTLVRCWSGRHGGLAGCSDAQTPVSGRRREPVLNGDVKHTSQYITTVANNWSFSGELTQWYCYYIPALGLLFKRPHFYTMAELNSKMASVILPHTVKHKATCPRLA